MPYIRVGLEPYLPVSFRMSCESTKVTCLSSNLADEVRCLEQYSALYLTAVINELQNAIDW